MVEKSEMEKIYMDYLRQLSKASADRFLRLALSRAVESYRRNTETALRLFPHTVELAEKLREIKEYSLLHVDELISQARDMIEDLKGHFYLAKTPDDAMDYIGDLVKPGDIVVKSKSLTSEELHMNPRLEEMGCEVYETDLGEFLIQQLKSKPMHILSPAIHVPREKAAEVISKAVGKELPPDIPLLVGEVRKILRGKFFEAKVGISGANVIAAETGSVFIIENEGNARLVTGLPEKHIVIAGIEKLVPSLLDAMIAVEVTSRYANYKAPAYVSMISCPSKTGDIEKQTTYGAHGPKEYHVILLDNGRKEMIKDPIYRQALYCLRCGGCMYNCTIYPLVAGNFGYIYMGGIGVPLTRFLLGGLERAAPIAYTCTMCGRCVEHCPMKIDVPKIVQKIREEAAKAGIMPERLRENLGEITGVKI